MTGDWLTLGVVGMLFATASVRRSLGSRAREKYTEVGSDLFRESGVNVYEPGKIERYRAAMRASQGWSNFPPIHGVLQSVDVSDLEDWREAEEGGYTHELAWSRPLLPSDLGKTYVAIEDGHHRAYAARQIGIALRVKEWP